MNETKPNLVEEFEDLVDAHAEYEGEIDDGNVEALEIYEAIGLRLAEISRSIDLLQRQRQPPPEELDEIEEALAEVGDALAELAATL